MTAATPIPKHTFTERAAASNLDDAGILNSNNPHGPDLPAESDVVIAGGGIHGLIYAIHAAKHKPGALKIALVEKNSRPGYKIGESTLPLFSMWCKMYGLTGEYLLRIFGVKDGLCFYFLNREKEGEYTDSIIKGTAGKLLSGFQLERPMSELLFTLFAQRSGVDVYHGRQIDFSATKVLGGIKQNRIQVTKGKSDGQLAATIESSLFVDATGRFRQLASKNASLHRFEGWNYDAFWGYFSCPTDESQMPFDYYEGDHTNHLCFPEGWAWVIRLLSWQGNPTANLMDMLSYLLDCAEAGVPGDEIPSTEELCNMFDLKPRWVTSIGFAVRNDVKYPEDMSAYGSGEAERKFNYFVQKYPLIQQFMTNFDHIENLYGPGTSWFVRKSLTYQSPVVSGPGWVAIGDACGFTNPLYSPGITASMSTSTYAAELTHAALETASRAEDSETAEVSIRETFAPFDAFAKRLIPALNQMNRFNYLCFRDPRLGHRVSNVWQNLASAMAAYGSVQGKFSLTSETFLPYALSWAYGSMVPEYGVVARKAIELLAPIPLEETIPEAVVSEFIEFSDGIMAVAVKSLGNAVKWNNILRYYDDDLNYSLENTYTQDFTFQCCWCASWMVQRADWSRCYSCGRRQRADEEAAATPVAG